MRRQNLTAYLFLSPYLAVFAIFWAWPIVQSVYFSLLNTRVNPWRFQPSVNWGRLFGDSAFYNALWNSVFFLVVQVPVMLALATLLAVALNSTVLKWRGIFRFAFFAPVVVGEVAYSAIFKLLFNGQFGAVNGIIGSFGFSGPDWLSRPGTAWAVIIIAVTWRWTGYNAIIILAGLQSIPRELYEQAEVDGFSKYHQFRYITLPLLVPVLTFALVLSIIGSLQLFTEPLLITNGGPGSATETLGYFLYQAGFRTVNFGYASAIAYTVAILAATFSIIQISFFGRARG